MWIRRLELHNVRCFEDLSIQFAGPKTPVLLLGDNGDGKSTILRSLAMGLCDESSAAALFRELPGEYCRRTKSGNSSTNAFILIELQGAGGYSYEIKTEIHSLKAFERVVQRVYRIRGKSRHKMSQDDFPWEKIFVVGYGAGIRVLGTSEYQRYLAVDAVYPMFNYYSPLQNPELVVRRMVDIAEGAGRSYKELKTNRQRVLDHVIEVLNGLLRLRKGNRVHLGKAGLELVNSKGARELSSLGDGYRAVITLALDIMSWIFLRSEETNRVPSLYDVTGIVLIDEIEQHLHPVWQVEIMSLLREAFPQMQFIASTHSPLVASGAENCEVHVLDDGKHSQIEPYGWRAQDVYGAMGMESTRAKPIQRLLDEYRALETSNWRDSRDRSDKKRLEELRNQLRHLSGQDPDVTVAKLQAIASKLRSKKPKSDSSK